MIRIRGLESGDWPEMADVAEEAHGHMENLPGKFDREAWVRNYQQFASTPAAMILLTEIDGVVRGGICGALTVDPASDDVIAVMMWWHFARAYRGSGVKLLKRWMNLARERGAVRLTMNHLLDLHSNRLEAFYLRMGMRPLEKIYIMEL